VFPNCCQILGKVFVTLAYFDMAKLIYVGELKNEPDRDSGWIREFSNLGWESIPFSTQKPKSSSLWGRVCYRLKTGKDYKSLRADLLELVAKEMPDWVHFRLPVEFDRKTICAIKSFGVIVTEYCNDDPFSVTAPFGTYSKFKRAIAAYDMHFVFREHNLVSFYGAGARYAEHCPPYYDESVHKTSVRPGVVEFVADAAFVGHWEDDGRLGYLEALVRSGYSVALRGSYWDRPIRKTALEEMGPVRGAFFDEYNFIYANAMVGICFFSKINRDAWTRRPLEIVAVGGLLVCERTEEALAQFKDKEEAFFFSSVSELLEIVKVLKSNPELRRRVRDAGYRRLKLNGDTLRSRACQIDGRVKEMLERSHTDKSY
jgi:spore maturation protein CgeB